MGILAAKNRWKNAQRVRSKTIATFVVYKIIFSMKTFEVKKTLY